MTLAFDLSNCTQESSLGYKVEGMSQKSKQASEMVQWTKVHAVKFNDTSSIPIPMVELIPARFPLTSTYMCCGTFIHTYTRARAHARTEGRGTEGQREEGRGLPSIPTLGR